MIGGQFSSPRSQGVDGGGSRNVTPRLVGLGVSPGAVGGNQASPLSTPRPHHFRRRAYEDTDVSEMESDCHLPKFTPSEEFKAGRREERARRRKEVEDRKKQRRRRRKGGGEEHEEVLRKLRKEKEEMERRLKELEGEKRAGR